MANTPLLDEETHLRLSNELKWAFRNRRHCIEDEQDRIDEMMNSVNDPIVYTEDKPLCISHPDQYHKYILVHSLEQIDVDPPYKPDMVRVLKVGDVVMFLVRTTCDF